MKQQLPFIRQRWAHDFDLSRKLHDFLVRARGDFRDQVMKLLSEPVDGRINELPFAIQSWEEGLATDRGPEDLKANQLGTNTKLTRRTQQPIAV